MCFSYMHYIFIVTLRETLFFSPFPFFSSGNDIKYDLWIGMRYDITSTSRVYRWINCEIPTFTIWSHYEPNYQLRDRCIRMDKDLSFQLRTTLCTKVNDYLCTGRTIKTMCLLF